MKVKYLTPEEMRTIAARPEGHFFDRKGKGIDGRKVQKIAVALANADGGDFVVGIKDDKDEPNPAKRWDGASDMEFFNFVLQNLTDIRPTVSYTSAFLCESANNTYVLQITIEKSERVHCTTDNTVYVRNGSQSLPLKDPQKIQELSFSKGESSFEDLVYKDARAEDIFESAEMASFLKDYSPASDPIDFTVNQNLVDRVTYDPKISGLLLFCDNPVLLLPKKCGIKITRYDTDDLVPQREHLKDQTTIEGCLYTQIQNASATVSRIMSNVKVWTPTGLGSVNYPPETIWEILVNAVIHRDYSISDDVHVLIYNNRIEIISPGKLPGYVNEENILDARCSRNTKIVRTLNRYKNPPNKDMGEGLNTAFQKMKDYRLKEPTIKVEGNYVKATIWHIPIASPEESVVEYLSKNPTIRNGQARQITHIQSENKMKRVFYKLRDSGLIEPVMNEAGNRILAWRKVEKP